MGSIQGLRYAAPLAIDGGPAGAVAGIGGRESALELGAQRACRERRGWHSRNEMVGRPRLRPDGVFFLRGQSRHYFIRSNFPLRFTMFL